MIDPDDMLLAERDENEVRKDFTPSERAHIARTVIDQTPVRQGRPSKEEHVVAERFDPKKVAEEILDNYPEIPAGMTTREFAAKAAGFDSEFQYRQAARVVDRGIPDLVEAMDRGEVSIAAAAEVATLPEPA